VPDLADILEPQNRCHYLLLICSRVQQFNVQGGERTLNL
jgi:hypothetical protein